MSANSWSPFWQWVAKQKQQKQAADPRLAAEQAGAAYAQKMLKQKFSTPESPERSIVPFRGRKQLPTRGSAASTVVKRAAPLESPEYLIDQFRELEQLPTRGPAAPTVARQAAPTDVPVAPAAPQEAPIPDFTRGPLHDYTSRATIPSILESPEYLIDQFRELEQLPTRGPVAPTVARQAAPTDVPVAPTAPQAAPGYWEQRLQNAPDRRRASLAAGQLDRAASARRMRDSNYAKERLSAARAKGDQTMADYWRAKTEGPESVDAWRQGHLAAAQTQYQQRMSQPPVIARELDQQLQQQQRNLWLENNPQARLPFGGFVRSPNINQPMGDRPGGSIVRPSGLYRSPYWDIQQSRDIGGNTHGNFLRGGSQQAPQELVDQRFQQTMSQPATDSGLTDFRSQIEQSFQNYQNDMRELNDIKSQILTGSRAPTKAERLAAMAQVQQRLDQFRQRNPAPAFQQGQQSAGSIFAPRPVQGPQRLDQSRQQTPASAFQRGQQSAGSTFAPRPVQGPQQFDQSRQQTPAPAFQQGQQSAGSTFAPRPAPAAGSNTRTTFGRSASG